MNDSVTAERVQAMLDAIELEVDDDDFRFVSPSEREVWASLVCDHLSRLDKDDCAWLPAAA